MKKLPGLLTVIWFLILFQGAAASAAVLDSRRTTLDFDWRFIRGESADAEQTGIDDSKWSRVDLPHDWSIAGPFDQSAPAGGGGGYLPTGIGWYRKVLKLPEHIKKSLVTLEFDGVYENSSVWMNGHFLGVRPYGYTSFLYDVTPYINDDGHDNLLAVRVDNSPQPNSRWYSGSGIYRHVWLLISDDLHIPQWGTYVTTPTISNNHATVDAAVRVMNESTSIRKFSLHCTVLDSSCKEVGSTSREYELNSGAGDTFRQSIQISNPMLWSVESPTLYTLRCEIVDGSTVIDQYTTPFGIRSASFDADKGFILNGTPVKLNGVCLHSDGGGVGVAVPEALWARRLKALKEMGCNAIRTSHNPPAPEFLDLCDQMGFLVMDEAFDAWEQGKRQNDYHLHFKEWSQRDLTDFIRRDRNHPSVILWSAGNEIGEQAEKTGIAVVKKLVDTFHTEDPTRPVTAACDRVYAEPQSALPEFLSVLDIVGYNYVDRWRDRADKYYSLDRQAFPSRKFVGTESVSMAGIRGDYKWLLNRPVLPPAKPGQYQKPPAINNSINVELLWKFVHTYDYVSGDFMWTGIDYLGEAGWPNKLATFGTLDTCGFKKDSYYFYQSQWTNTPVLHLMPQWNLKGQEGQIIPVTCFTNCDTVELFVNGKSFGAKGYEFPRQGMQKKYGVYPARDYISHTTADLHLSWDVPYEPGTLKAVGSMNGQTITQTLSTAGNPVAIRLTPDQQAVNADGRDIVCVTIQVIDDKGQMVPVANDDINFELSGNARLLSVDNGNPTSDESFQAMHRRAFNGMCLAILQSTQKSGPIHFTASANGLKSASVNLNAQSN